MSGPLASAGKAAFGLVGHTIVGAIKSPTMWLGAGAAVALKHLPKIGPKLPLSVRLVPLAAATLLELGAQMVEESRD